MCVCCKIPNMGYYQYANTCSVSMKKLEQRHWGCPLFAGVVHWSASAHLNRNWICHFWTYEFI